MQAEKPTVHRSVHYVHTPFGGTNTHERTLLVRRTQLSEEDPRRRSGSVMSSPQPLAMNE